MRRIPVPILVTLAVLLLAGPLGLLLSARDSGAAPPAPDRLADVARRAGCTLTELRGLDELARRDPDLVLLFENQTGMRPRIAATAHLSRMTCPRVDRSTLGALAAFRDRRRAFGQAF